MDGQPRTTVVGRPKSSQYPRSRITRDGETAMNGQIMADGKSGYGAAAREHWKRSPSPRPTIADEDLLENRQPSNSDSSGRGVNLAPNTNDTGKKEVACTRCKNSFPSNNKLHQHIREGSCKSVQPKGGSDAEDFRQQPNSTWIANGRGASKTVKEKAANEGEAENTSSNAKEERWGDSNSKCSDFTSPFGYIPPPLNFRNKTRDVSSKFDQLVQNGALNSKEILLLEKSRGLEFLVHLTHLESMASTKTWKTIANQVDGIPKTEIDQDYPYCTVHALLIRWEDGDLDFDWAINGLREVFKDQFGFHLVSSFKIPSNRPYEALESKLQYFKEAHSSKSRLLIVYYIGHGYLDLQNRMHWCATSSRDSPTLDWYALQVGLERTESDVLILLHACCSAGASNLSHEPKLNRGGRTEIIAACSFKSTTSDASFTKTLIGELKRMAQNDSNFGECISATLPDGDDPGIMLISNDSFSTPVYISLSNDFRQASIPIKRFGPLKPLRRIRSRDSFRTFLRGAMAEEEHDEDVPGSEDIDP
ncbi:uncharacterized protein K444DRAFT_624299 [Hyaloscypha bicolor E]|uniref:Uncharacterized protein n=1 Tax=Hyaloscypha bicolor E TaxID=1095630 RepID=A0A2J6TV43_9HELO|nr:uncharacterized protein K444DRAFT_624299 [Hyaloscypha bicolor E]PMD66828.1 hypothetical protein K444DRAFT_624299 [Hyaloscypha bicolor E]